MTISFEDVPYEGTSIPTSHPERLASDAWLRGLRAPDPTRARILELGCAEGANIVPIAYHYEDAEVVGVDFSPRHIEIAEQAKHELGLDNLRVACASITDLSDAVEGPFDYILCHGVLSWVSEEVQDAIFAALRDYLAPNGIGYVSYNVVPGWKMRGLVREVLMARTRDVEDPREKLAVARSTLQLLATTMPHEMPYSRYMAEEARSTLEHRDPYIAHEYLSEHNRPYLYGDIVRLAGRFGLRFFSEQSPVGHPAVEARIRETVGAITDDPIEGEELTDVLHGRAFRASTFVREDLELADPDECRRELLEEAGFVTELRPLGKRPSLAEGETEEFSDAADVRVAVKHPVLKAALLVLAQTYPRAMLFETLEAQAVALLQLRRVFKIERVLSDGERESLREDLLRLVDLGHLRLKLTLPSMVTEAGPTPRVSTLTRYEARQFRSISTAFHEPLSLDDASSYLISLMDGSLDHDELARALVATLEEHDMVLRDESGEPLGPEAAQKAMGTFVQHNLRMLEAQGLLER